MKFVIAPDSFKGSLTAQNAARAIQAGLMEVFPDAEYELVPIADGGEGTVETLVQATDGSLQVANVLDPLGRTVQATYGILGDSKTAVIEMAAASGLHLVEKAEMNPLVTTTYGTGQLILDALDHQIRRFIIGLGGSATNDGGAGMAEALGVRFLDQQKRNLTRGGAALANLETIDMAGLDPRLAETEIILAVDVKNPLIGDQGASVVFGPQKGATPEMVQQLDQALTHYADVLTKQYKINVANISGAGAAGGLGAGFMAFTTVKIRSGIEVMMEAVDLKSRVKAADYVFVGEGSIDFQTQFGKAPIGVAKIVKNIAPHATVIGLAGSIGKESATLYNLGIDAIFSIVPGVVDLKSAIDNGAKNLKQTTSNLARLISLKK
ncbi:glycerate kinase [Weissella coleopterorum]|uniref:Glycerate kinase n=1 Tax=Weissella coleopterorum TaxID=2714949 RepID=A0A6G8AZN0_9LACO|nr:glycerate kinase [Weissella coleopterorum]QIL50333.1 glycerate kinase [Weissella coleopterorum]